MKTVLSILFVVSLAVLLAMSGGAPNQARVVPAQAFLDRSRVVEIPAPAPETVPLRPGRERQASAASAGPLASSVTILQDSFEGGFPGTNWTLLVGGPQAYWGLTSYRFFDGSHSVYCAAAGSAGVPAPGPYLANMNAWMTYGPFSLADATAASATFAYWM